MRKRHRAPGSSCHPALPFTIRNPQSPIEKIPSAGEGGGGGGPGRLAALPAAAAMRPALLLVVFVCLAGVGRAQAPSLSAYAGAWHGAYVATQGVTGVVVTVTPDSETTFTGHFIFFRDPSTPDTPTGHYTTRGGVDPQSGRLWFDGDTWLEQPDNYAFVALSGLLDPADGAWKGEVFMDPFGDGPVRVGTFRLERIY